MGRGESEITQTPSGIAITRSVVDRVDLTRCGEGIQLMQFTPGAPDHFNQPQSWVIEDEAAEWITSQPDPLGAYEQLVGSGEAPHRPYNVLREDAPDVLNDVPFAEVGWEGLFCDDAAQAVTDAGGELPRDRLLLISGYDHSAWVPGLDRPRARVMQVEFGDCHHDLRKLQERLSQYPHCLRHRQFENRVVPNWDISGRELVRADFLLPQDVFDELDRWKVAREHNDELDLDTIDADAPEEIAHLSDSDLARIFDWSSRTEEDGEWIPEGWHDPLRLREAGAVKQEDAF